MALPEPATSPVHRIILHVDMDAFYAAVEMRENPAIRGRPVIVGADPKGGKGRGVVSTASYEARVHGVHSAMPISKAFERCPAGIFIRPRYDLYIRVSGDVMAIARGFAGQFEQVSIDEAYLDISGAGDYSTARAVAVALKDAIRNKTGLTCSVGVAPSKVVAKIASDYRKPDGLTIVKPGSVIDFLSPLPVGKIPGVGKKSREALEQMGISTIGDLSRIDVQELIALFGKWGVLVHDLSLGIDDREVRQEEGYKSISREVTFETDTDDENILTQTLEKMARELHGVLISEKLRFRTITVKFRNENFQTRTRSRTLDRYTDDFRVIMDTSSGLMPGRAKTEKIRLLGIRLSGFEPGGSRQTTIGDF